MVWIYGESQPQFIETRKNLGRNQRRINYNIQPTDGTAGYNYRWLSVKLEPGVWTYDAIVDAIIRAEYPADKMQAVINNYLLDQTNDNALEEMRIMQTWRAAAKEIARQALEEIPAEGAVQNLIAPSNERLATSS